MLSQSFAKHGYKITGLWQILWERLLLYQLLSHSLGTRDSERGRQTLEERGKLWRREGNSGRNRETLKKNGQEN